VLLLLCLLSPLVANVRAETGHEAWRRYFRLAPKIGQKYANVPIDIVSVGDTVILAASRKELIVGLAGLLGSAPRKSANPIDRSIVLGKAADLESKFPKLSVGAISDEGYRLKWQRIGEKACLVIAGGGDRGVLYGVFALLSKIARGEDISALNEVQNPAAEIRWVDQWDNLDGSIERGYAGSSIYFYGGRVRDDLTRASEYARLLASIGINGCNINNVNANPRVLQSDFLPQIARIADEFRHWGVHLSLSVDLSSPTTIGGLETFDPVDPRVAAWWNGKANEIYTLIPDFGLHGEG